MKKKVLKSSLILILIAVIAVIGSTNEFAKRVEHFVSTYNNRLLAGNEITSIDTPVNLTWIDESTATATWDSVENANYYKVRVHVYDEDGIELGNQETGTSANQLDIQQEIISILGTNSLDTYQVLYTVIAQCIMDDEIVFSDESNYSIPLIVNKKSGLKLSSPQNPTFSSNGLATWTNVANAGYYQVEYTFIYNGISRTYTDLMIWKSDGIVKDGVFKINLTNSMNNAYKYLGYDGKTVSVSYKVKSRSNVGDNTYNDGDYSLQSSTIEYYQDVSSLSSPQNPTFSSNGLATWTNVANAGYYQVEYTFIYNGISRTYTDLMIWKSDGIVKDGVFKINLTNSMNNAYKYLGYDGKTVSVSYKVKSRTDSKDTIHKDSDYSLQSPSISYTQEISKLDIPTLITFNSNGLATWTNVANAGYYQVEYTFIYNGISRTYTNLMIWKSDGIVKDGVFKINLTNNIYHAYQHLGYDGKTVSVSYKVKSRTDSKDTIHKDSDYSISSPIIFYNSEGSTYISDITLSPNKPIIAVGRSLYIGKTIEPNTALYDFINWTSSNNQIVTISNMGQITGVKKGKATITAKINNASQIAEVSVYEIESNVVDSDESKQVIDEANDVIEAVITDGDISNTDITNKENAVIEIEQGAQNGDMFNVDITYDTKSSSDYSSIKDDILADYEGFNIIGGNDIKVEISHKDNEGNSHHIANITELENEVNLEFDISSQIPELPNTKTREYKVIRVHGEDIEEVNFEIENGIVSTESNKFSDFIVLASDKDIPVTGISVDKTDTEINVGETDTIIVSILPENAANQNYTSISNNEEIATIEGNVITAVAPGNTTVVFTSTDGEFTKTINVVVKAPLKSISLNKTEGTMNVGETENLTVIYNPTNTTDDKTVIWTSSNEEIATVADGVVTALAIGKATITATVGDKTATYTIDVKLPLTSISLNKTEGTLIAERTELLTVTYNPTNTTDDKTVTWTSSDEDIATVTDGYVTAISEGDVEITAKVGTKTATYNLHVIQRIALVDISFSETEGTLNVGQDMNLTVIYNPTETNDDKTITWESSNPGIAYVDNGNIVALAPGEATITAKVGDKTATYTLTVKAPLKNILLNKDNGTLRLGSSEILTVSYFPTNTTDDKTIVWSSKDEKAATVKDGKVTAVGLGSTNIEAKVGNLKEYYYITVIEKETLQETAVKTGLKVKNNFLHGFKLDDLLTSIKTKLGINVSTSGNSTVIATGVQFTYNSETFTAVVYGDLNGDGKINSADLLKMRQHLLGTSTLAGSYKEAGSIATGTTINSADLLRIRQHLLGQKQIEQ